ncbi:MAG: Rpn family recombination-promoting nuclease/putative transposase [Treponema sp.]|nr:Rpn family recombination-promoting nuclease/putative transposase [Treponema sp.]
MNVNRNFKDSVFTRLFGNPDLLRELYCALRGISLPPDIPVSINTLENVLYMDLYNDISFEIDGKLIVLIEHQSSINPNMALRLLFYISRVLEKKIKSSTLYSKKKLIIPWPEFYVLYNGIEPYPDENIMKLSDLFENTEDLCLHEKIHPLLELEVKVININEGRNEAIVMRCKKLSDYSKFIGKIYAFLNEMNSLEEAVKKTIIFCRKHDILNEFLEIYASEVLNMISLEWNTEDAIAFAREEGLNEGHEKGRAEEKFVIARNLLAEGMTPEFVQKITGLSVKEIEKLR